MVVHPAGGHWNGTFVNALIHHVWSQRRRAEQAEDAVGAMISPMEGSPMEGSPTSEEAAAVSWEANERVGLIQAGVKLTKPEEAAAEEAAALLPDLDGDGIRHGVVHRLDRNTSGVLLGAKTPYAQRLLIKTFEQRKLCKIYLAVVVGKPSSLTCVCRPIGAHGSNPVLRAITRTGKPALSMVHCLATDGERSLVAVRIYTGRTHQIRIHLKHIGHPVLGDPWYGDGRANRRAEWHGEEPRALLHALQLKLAHPSTRKPLVLDAPPPEDIREIGARLAGVQPDEFDEWLVPRVDKAAATTINDLIASEGGRTRLYAACSIEDVIEQLKARRANGNPWATRDVRSKGRRH
jgi:23S rRNA-/tRNA-specific pseudouridylate synthase